MWKSSKIIESFLLAGRDRNFVRNKIQEIASEGALGLVLGAGASIPGGFPAWEEFRCRVLEASGLEVWNQLDSINDIGVLKSYIRSALYHGTRVVVPNCVELQCLQRLILGKLDLTSIVSYNYDCYLEEHLVKQVGSGSVMSLDDIAHLKKAGKYTVYHPHGIVKEVGFGSDGDSVAESPVVLSSRHERERASLNSIWDRRWASFIDTYIIEHVPLFIGLGGDEDVWHRHLSVSGREVTGVWLLGPGATMEQQTRIEELRCLPVVFETYQALWDFVASLGD